MKTLCGYVTLYAPKALTIFLWFSWGYIANYRSTGEIQTSEQTCFSRPACARQNLFYLLSSVCRVRGARYRVTTLISVFSLNEAKPPLSVPKSGCMDRVRGRVTLRHVRRRLRFNSHAFNSFSFIKGDMVMGAGLPCHFVRKFFWVICDLNSARSPRKWRLCRECGDCDSGLLQWIQT